MSEHTFSPCQMQGPGSIHTLGDMVLAFGEPALFTGGTRHLHVEEEYSEQNLKCCVSDVKNFESSDEGTIFVR